MMMGFYTTTACCSIGEEQCKLAGSSAVSSEQSSLQIVSSQENVKMSRRPTKAASAGNNAGLFHAFQMVFAVSVCY